MHLLSEHAIVRVHRQIMFHCFDALYLRDCTLYKKVDRTPETCWPSVYNMEWTASLFCSASLGLSVGWCEWGACLTPSVRRFFGGHMTHKRKIFINPFWYMLRGGGFAFCGENWRVLTSVWLNYNIKLVDQISLLILFDKWNQVFKINDMNRLMFWQSCHRG